ncbi:MAG: preprotein translocase subunit SecY [Clostridia bacterium]|nr:preprotein translocase subunit SecY [Clostridia bacterium]
MFKTLRDAWKIKDLRRKLLWTLLLLIIFRFGANITAPGVDGLAVAEYSKTIAENGILYTLNIITGGGFSQLAIFAMSIGPYITASIVIQLLTVAIPALEELQKEGEAGKQKLNDYTKYLAIVLGAIEAFGVYMMYRTAQVPMLQADGSYVYKNVFLGETMLTPFVFIMSLTAGSTLLMWIADKISNLGVANGSSLLIFAGIVVGLPNGIMSLVNSLVIPNGVFSPLGLLAFVAILVGAIVLIAAVVWVTEAERRVSVQYAKRVVGRKMYGGQSTNIPIKLAMAGVMPIIFAMSFMQFPSMIIGLINSNIANETGFWAGVYKVFSFTSLTDKIGNWGYGVAHILIYLALIAIFTYFYTKMIFNTTEVANNLKKNGGFIPGIRAGKPTSDYLSNILKYVSGFGSIFLGVIAIIPILLAFTGLGVSFGGTAILIVVSVALETMKQLEAQMMVRNYKGFLD